VDLRTIGKNGVLVRKKRELLQNMDCPSAAFEEGTKERGGKSAAKTSNKGNWGSWLRGRQENADRRSQRN